MQKKKKILRVTSRTEYYLLPNLLIPASTLLYFCHHLHVWSFSKSYCLRLFFLENYSNRNNRWHLSMGLYTQTPRWFGCADPHFAVIHCSLNHANWTHNYVPNRHCHSSHECQFVPNWANEISRNAGQFVHSVRDDFPFMVRVKRTLYNDNRYQWKKCAMTTRRNVLRHWLNFQAPTPGLPQTEGFCHALSRTVLFCFFFLFFFSKRAIAARFC